MPLRRRIAGLGAVRQLLDTRLLIRLAGLACSCSCLIRLSAVSRNRRGVSSFVSSQCASKPRTLRSVNRRPLSGTQPCSLRIAAICCCVCPRPRNDDALLQFLIGAGARCADAADPAQPRLEVIDGLLVQRSPAAASSQHHWSRFAISVIPTPSTAHALSWASTLLFVLIIDENSHTWVAGRRGSSSCHIRHLAEVVAVAPGMCGSPRASARPSLPSPSAQQAGCRSAPAPSARVQPDGLADSDQLLLPCP